MTTTYPATTLWQPWASLIAIGGVKVDETRDYPPPLKHIGHRIAIHAAIRRPRPEELALLSRTVAAWPGKDDRFISAAAKALDLLDRPSETLPVGVIVCTAMLAGAYQCGELVAPTRRSILDRALGSLPRADILVDPYGDFRLGRWAWWLTDIAPLPTPAPAKGKQGWWIWTANTSVDGSMP